MSQVWVVINANASPGQRVEVLAAYTAEADARAAGLAMGEGSFIGPVELDPEVAPHTVQVTQWPEGYYPNKFNEQDE